MKTNIKADIKGRKVALKVGNMGTPIWAWLWLSEDGYNCETRGNINHDVHPEAMLGVLGIGQSASEAMSDCVRSIIRSLNT